MSNETPSILLFSMPCALSAPVLAMLEQRRERIVGIVSPSRVPGAAWQERRRRQLIDRTPTSAPIPSFAVRSLDDSGLVARLAELRPDVIVVACFPWLIPDSIIRLARWEAVNIHPSLLPSHQGPDPLFWTFHAGERSAGSTIHRLTNRYDDGPILLQRAIDLDDPVTHAMLEQTLGRLGANLLAEMLDSYPVHPTRLPAIAGIPGFEGFPGAADFVISSQWSVEHARRFITGVARSHGPLRYQDARGASVPVYGLAVGNGGVEIVLRNGSLHVATTANELKSPLTIR